MRDCTWTWRWALQSSPEKLWPLVADTDRFNRFTGLPPVQFSMVPVEIRGVQREGRFRILGLPLVWDEYPFEFEAPRRFSVLRRYHGGFFHELEALLKLEPKGGGTELTYTIRVRPRNFLGLLVAKLQVGLITRFKFNQAFKRIDKAVSGSEPQPLEAPGLGAAYRERLAGALGDIHHVQLLLDFLTTAPASELADIRVFRLAHERGVSRDELLSLFLHATKAGLLEVGWQIVCPCCRGEKARAARLRDLRFELRCESCNIDFTADFTRLTELTFRLATKWKDVRQPVYCVGSPMRTPHIKVQLRAAAQTKTRLNIELPPGQYRVRSPVSRGEVVLTVAAAISTENLATAALVLTRASLSPQELTAQGRFTLEIDNRLAHEAAVAIERTEWTEHVVTADYVLAFQDFRDLFGDDVLAPGTAVQVANVALLFTDLKDSTALYTRTGDARAFGVVSSHFDILDKIIQRHHGAQVKNIGDAVMAVFGKAADALRAAVEMHHELKKLRTSDGREVVLKTGLHAGPCFAVTLNDNLDYFGTTVNLAARIQGQSEGADIVLDAALAATLCAPTDFSEFQREEFEAELKGIVGKRRLLRLRLR